MTRRNMLLRSASGLGLLAASPVLRAFAGEDAGQQTQRRFKIGACDWSVGQRQKPEAFAVAKEIGLDGLEISFSDPGLDYDLRDEKVREQYLGLAKKEGIEIASLAMGVLNSVPYAEDPRTEKWVADVVDVMPKLGVKICLLAFFGKGNINGERAKQDEVIRRLKKVAPQAEKAGVVLGVESRLNAEDHIRIVEEVASPAVQVYYDVANMTQQGYDIYKEIRQLGKERICQIHMKENGFLLGEGKVDFPRVKEAIDEIGYAGWLIIEGATVRGKSLVECYQHNRKYLRSVFPTG
ncbi:MAG: sugar phosphate isomerase/epimerase [Planctomycetes bacterium]|nr:sugar phosphate isomerase/epimerase [Planctomycetota bacterium]MBL7039923.1 sugar phosphate isomerase/epimerase [Pirellulaceae bacterium]